jgi:transcriptional regulator with XRE-family HTH domain
MSLINDTERQQFRQAVGARVRTLRARHGYSQADLAMRAGLHRTFVGAVERGRNGINLGRLPDLAAALEVEPHTLIPGWGAFSGASPEDLWNVPLELGMPEDVRHEHAQRRLSELLDDSERRHGPIDPEIHAQVDEQWRAIASS